MGLRDGLRAWRRDTDPDEQNPGESVPSEVELQDLELAATTWRRDAQKRMQIILVGGLLLALEVALVAGLTAPGLDLFAYLPADLLADQLDILRAGAARFEPDESGAVVATIAQLVVGVSVAVVLAPRLSKVSHTSDRISTDGWLRGAAVLVSAAAGVSVALTSLAVFSAGESGTLSHGWYLVPLAAFTVGLASLTGRRAQDSADVLEPERNRRRVDTQIERLRAAGVTPWRTLRSGLQSAIVFFAVILPARAIINHRGQWGLITHDNVVLVALSLLGGFPLTILGVLPDVIRARLLRRGRRRAATHVYRAQVWVPWAFLAAAVTLGRLHIGGYLLLAALAFVGFGGLWYAVLVLGWPRRKRGAWGRPAMDLKNLEQRRTALQLER